MVPAMLGCRLAATGLINDPQRRRERKKREEDGGWEICEVPWQCGAGGGDSDLSFPPKRRMPAQVSRADAIFNTRIWVAAARAGNRSGDWLRAALQGLHQPYRRFDSRL